MVVSWEKPLGEEERLEYGADVRAFLDSETTTRVAIDAGRAFHQARVDIARPIVGAPSPYSIVDEIDERVDLARDAQQAIRDEADSQGLDAEIYRAFRFNLMQFSAFLCADLQHLRRIVRGFHTGTSIYNSVIAVDALLGNCECLQFLIFLRCRNHIVAFIFPSLIELMAEKAAVLLAQSFEYENSSAKTRLASTGPRGPAAVKNPPGEHIR